MTTYTTQDANPITWSELEMLTDRLIASVSSYFENKNEKVDVIAPLLRTGGIIGGMLASKMKVVPMLPVQFKYSYNPLTSHQITSIPDMLVELPESMNILLCEGNTSSGTLSKRAAAAIKEKYPHSKVYLATLTRVYGGPETLEGIEEIFHGIRTDENFKVDEETRGRLGLRTGITVFPWEDVAEEISEINTLQ